MEILTMEKEVTEDREIMVTEKGGIFIVPAELEEGFVLVPTYNGKMSLVFWEERCLNLFLENYGLVPKIIHE
ncbi:MAG: hypothetical protein AB1480_14295 [Nitrospirota bacterium]